MVPVSFPASIGGKVQTQSKQLKELLEMLGFYRGMVLDACEQEMGESPRWAFLRSRLLKIFGQRGMEEKIIKIMGEAIDE
jgi:hypothetical protein